MGYTNSSLVDCTVKSPNHSGQRTHKIDRITPHCVVGQLSAEGIGGCFTSTSREASCNYGIGYDGRVCLIVDEANRSWCSSSRDNDQRAITIEVASDSTEPYAFKDAAYKKLVKLCIDICKRNGLTKVLWIEDKNTSLNYTPKAGECVLTVHRWFANKSCPGTWMYSRMGQLANEINAGLGAVASTPTTPATSTPAINTNFPATPFTVKVLIPDLNYRSSGSMSGAVRGQTGKGVFTIVEVNQDGWGKLKSGAGWIYLENPSYCTIQGKVATSTPAPTPTTPSVTTPTTSTVTLTGNSNEEKIWNYIYSKLGNAYGTAGIMGNIYAESGCRPNNLQNSYETKLGMTDDQYTAAVDNGSYTNFIKDSAGYGLVQWTYWSLKQDFYNYVKSKGASIGDLGIQLEFLCKQLSENYTSSVWNVCKNATTVLEASNAMLLKFERPADQSAAVQSKRAGYGQTYYDKYAKTPTTTTPAPTTPSTPAPTITTTTNVQICHSSIDENGHASGGAAGDQTGKEVYVRSWYSKPWDVMLRYPDASIAAQAAAAAKKLADSNLVGYDQGGRNTLYQQLKANNWDVDKYIASKVKTESDCSSFVYACYAIFIPAMRSDSNAPVTSNMKSKYTAWGFKAYTDSKYISEASYLRVGDILVKSSAHTVMSISNGVNSASDVVAPSTSTPAASAPSTSGTTARRTATDYAASRDDSLAGTYVTTANLNVRNGAGTSKSLMTTIPYGHTVKNYGYYTAVNGTKWLYVQFTYKEIVYTGFVSGDYLKRA